MEREINKMCCDVFHKMISNFNWMSLVDNGKRIFLMPYIENEQLDLKIRVNNCPSCGAEVRDITIDEETFMNN